MRFLHNMHLPIDELKLRASVSNEKKELLMTFQKHITMF